MDVSDSDTFHSSVPHKAVSIKHKQTFGSIALITCLFKKYEFQPLSAAPCWDLVPACNWASTSWVRLQVTQRGEEERAH